MMTFPPHRMADLVLDLAPQAPCPRPMDGGIGFTVINFNTAAQTLRCVASLGQCHRPPEWIVVLDNASTPTDYERLKASLMPLKHSRIQLFRSSTNLGFAAGSNLLIEQLLNQPECQYIGLLNNDAVAQPGLVSSLHHALAQGSTMVGMSGGRMHKLHQPDTVDTLGISLYASLMPADRKDTDDPCLGPTGGCCLMTRDFLIDLQTTTGYCFDERYFCYCEDTDLVLRANLLGYQPTYVDELVALHEGQASSGGKHNNFIAYHGLRNAIWMQYKLMPSSVLWRHAAPLLLAHTLTLVRQILSGRWRLLWSVYRDAFGQLGQFKQERQHLAQIRRIDGPMLRQKISPHFYRRGYAAVVWSEWKSLWRAAKQ